MFRSATMRWATALVMATVALTACGQPRGTVHGEGDDALPSETMTEWVSYSDKLALVRVVSEEVMGQADPNQTADHGVAYVGRRVTVHVLREFWTRPGFAGTLPSRFSYVAPGWAEKDGKRADFVIGGGPRVEVSHVYLAPLSLTDRGWGPLSISATLPVDNNNRVSGDVADTNSPGPAISAVAGKSPGAIADIMSATKADPRMAPYASLNATDRWNKVIAPQRAATVEPSGSATGG